MAQQAEGHIGMVGKSHGFNRHTEEFVGSSAGRVAEEKLGAWEAQRQGPSAQSLSCCAVCSEQLLPRKRQSHACLCVGRQWQAWECEQRCEVSRRASFQRQAQR